MKWSNILYEIDKHFKNESIVYGSKHSRTTWHKIQHDIMGSSATWNELFSVAQTSLAFCALNCTNIYQR